MSKKNRHLDDLRSILSGSSISNVRETLYKYIVENSNLPGPRANLELATSFEEIISHRISMESAKALWDFCSAMAALSAENAPSNDPSEFIAFCGTRGLGAIGAAIPDFRMKALLRMRSLATDSRWRMREAVAMALWRLLATGEVGIREEIEEWIEQGDWLIMRGAVAGISEPSLLTDGNYAQWALQVHRKAIDIILASSDRKSDEFKTLRKALGYTLSVVVQAVPTSGFNLLESLLGKEDSDIDWIVKQNLKKKRLTTNFPTEVGLLKKQISQ